MSADNRTTACAYVGYVPNDECCRGGPLKPQCRGHHPLDAAMLPRTITAIPPRSDEGAWLSISQVTLTNMRGLVTRGRSEAADALAAHYWMRWQEAGQ